MINSLLAHLYPYIKGSQEDIATYSLQYLLIQSKELNRAFTNFISQKMSIKIENNLQYLCQVTGDGEEKERPDMVGMDSEKKEVVIFEMKFYASLTKNQPSTYLRRLKNNKGKGLLFVCPESRKTSLWTHLKDICVNDITQEINEFCVNIGGVNLAIVTWSEIIRLLKDVATSVDTSFVSDIVQLEGYCEKLASDAFVPFSADDLSAKVAVKNERYYSVVDEVINMIMADKTKKTSRDKLNSRGYRYGYTAKVAVGDYIIEILYDRKMWINPETVETPFWFTIVNKEWKQTKNIMDVINSVPPRKKDEYEYNLSYLALDVMEDKTKAEVCEDLTRQIFECYNKVSGEDENNQ